MTIRENNDNILYAADKRCMNFIVCSHMDKELDKLEISSRYEEIIQAGTVLTKKRISQWNDLDGGENISERNQRYCEMTAVYWIWKHVQADYVGIRHYRRKLCITDEQLDTLMAQGTDVILPSKLPLNLPIDEHYRKNHYTSDWELMLSILQQKYPEYYETATTFFGGRELNCFNMGIYRKEVFDDFCSWLFPILDEIYTSQPEKYDRQQRRDIGFLAERLSSLYWEHHRLGLKVVEVNTIFPAPAAPQIEIIADENVLLDKVSTLVAQHKIGAAAQMIDGAVCSGQTVDLLRHVVKIYRREKKELASTLFDSGFHGDMQNLLNCLKDLQQALYAYVKEGEKEAQREIISLVKDNGFSYLVLLAAGEQCGLKDEDFFARLEELLMDNNMLLYILPVFDYALQRYPDSPRLNKQLGTFLLNIGEYQVAQVYLAKGQ